MNVSWQWLAGFFDGEGHAAIRRYKDTSFFFAGLAQSGREGEQVLADIKEFLGTRDITVNVRRDAKPSPLSKRPMFRLTIQNRKNVVAFLTGIIPYVRVKRVIVQDILRYHKIYPQWTAAERSLVVNGRWELKRKYGSITRGIAV